MKDSTAIRLLSERSFKKMRRERENRKRISEKKGKGNSKRKHLENLSDKKYKRNRKRKGKITRKTRHSKKREMLKRGGKGMKGPKNSKGKKKVFLTTVTNYKLHVRNKI